MLDDVFAVEITVHSTRGGIAEKHLKVVDSGVKVYLAKTPDIDNVARKLINKITKTGKYWTNDRQVASLKIERLLSRTNEVKVKVNKIQCA